jgi:hypothetical protein
MIGSGRSVRSVRGTRLQRVRSASHLVGRFEAGTRVGELMAERSQHALGELAQTVGRQRRAALRRRSQPHLEQVAHTDTQRLALVAQRPFALLQRATQPPGRVAQGDGRLAMLGQRAHQHEQHDGRRRQEHRRVDPDAELRLAHAALDERRGSRCGCRAARRP